MRLRKAIGRLRNAEVAVVRVGAQPVRRKILITIMADRDALLRPPRLCRSRVRRRAMQFAQFDDKPLRFRTLNMTSEGAQRQNAWLMRMCSEP